MNNQDYQIATQGQTNFTIPFSYTVGNNSLRVMVNGSKQVSGLNYGELTDTTIAFGAGLNAGDVVEFISVIV